MKKLISALVFITIVGAAAIAGTGKSKHNASSKSCCAPNQACCVDHKACCKDDQSCCKDGKSSCADGKTCDMQAAASAHAGKSCCAKPGAVKSK